MGYNPELYFIDKANNATSAINQSSQIILQVTIGTKICATVPALIGNTTCNALIYGATRSWMSENLIRHPCYPI